MTPSIIIHTRCLTFYTPLPLSTAPLYCPSRLPPPMTAPSLHACVRQISLQESRADEAVKFDFAIVFAERQMNDGKIVIGGEWYDRKTRKVYHFDKIVNRIEKAGCYVQIYRSKAKTKLKTSKKDPPQDKCHYVIVEIGCR